MVGHDFRSEARLAVERARALLTGAGDLPALRYAALEVRTAMEALTYDRAQAFHKDLPPSKIRAWQPKRILAELLEINPRADMGVSVSIGKQPAKGMAADFEDMQDMGTETVLNMRVLKDHYNALGQRLHMPTLKQIEEGGGHDPERLRARLDRVIEYLDKVLASRIYNVTMIGRNSQIDCMRCGYRVRKAVDDDAIEMKCTCPQCGAPYVLVRSADGEYDWYADDVQLPCAASDCDAEISIFKDELKPGLIRKCGACGSETELVLGVALTD